MQSYVGLYFWFNFNFTLTGNEMVLKMRDLSVDASMFKQFAMALEIAVDSLHRMVTYECAFITNRQKCIQHVKNNGKILYQYMRDTNLNLKGGGSSASFRFDSNGDGMPEYDFFNYRKLGSGFFYMNRYAYKEIAQWTLNAGFVVTNRQQMNDAKVRQLSPTRNETVFSQCLCEQQGSTKN